MKKQSDDFARVPGAIIDDAMYTVDELVLRMRWGADDAALAVKKGLNGYLFADRVYVFGRDVMQFIREVGGKAGAE